MKNLKPFLALAFKGLNSHPSHILPTSIPHQSTKNVAGYGMFVRAIWNAGIKE